MFLVMIRLQFTMILALRHFILEALRPDSSYSLRFEILNPSPWAYLVSVSQGLPRLRLPLWPGPWAPLHFEVARLAPFSANLCSFFVFNY